MFILQTVETDVPFRVLVVDDEPSIGLLLKEFLSYKGYEVFFARDRTQAERYVLRARPHFVLLDIRLHEDNGLDILPKLIQIDPKINVIMISSVTEKEIGREALRRGAVDYLTKPIDFDYLQVSLQNKLTAMLETSWE